jgi:hypothetical protein
MRCTRSRKHCTSPSRAGRKFLCKSNIIRRHVRAFSSVSRDNVSVAIRRSSGAYGRKTSLFGSLFMISSTRWRNLTSTPSAGCVAGLRRRIVRKAGNRCLRKFAYSDVCTISILSRMSVAQRNASEIFVAISRRAANSKFSLCVARDSAVFGLTSRCACTAIITFA